MARVCLLFGLASFASAEGPKKPCVAPLQFEARVLYRDSSRSSSKELNGRLVYDATNKRKFISDEKPDVNGKKQSTEILQFFDEGVQYELDYANEECRRTHISTKFTYHDAGENATYSGDFYVGSISVSEGHVLLDTWRQTILFDEQELKWTGSFTSDGCVPVRTHVVYPKSGVVHTELLLNVVEGISDPDVFLVNTKLCPIPRATTTTTPPPLVV